MSAQAKKVKGRNKWVVWIRRVSQVVFVLLFFYLLLVTAYYPINKTGGPVSLFFEFDPLVLLSTWLAGAGALPSALLLSLIVVFGTLVFGRWFCGWVCPFGALNQFFSTLTLRKPKDRIALGAFTPHLKWKYYILFALLGSALVGMNLIGWFDPFSILTKGIGLAVYPLVSLGLVDFLDWIYAVDPGIGPVRLTLVTEPVYGFLQDHFLPAEQPHYWGSFLIGIILIAILLLNLVRMRFWCRYICPLGALLGLIGRNPIVRLIRDEETCSDCGLCVAECPGAANPDSKSWKPSECFYCWSCSSGCIERGITFKIAASSPKAAAQKAISWIKDNAVSRHVRDWFSPPRRQRIGMDRRAVLGAGLVGVTAGVMASVNPVVGGSRFSPSLIRPPGSQAEDEFLASCIRCGECMKVCPTNAIHPAWFEAGPVGLWTPVLKYEVGYCEYDCSLCTQVCPTDAITLLTVPEKQETKIGMAMFDRSRCLPWAYARSCIVCEEHCPLPEKAIYFEEVEVLDEHHEPVLLKQPRVNPDLCIGCGACQHSCVYQDTPAIRVHSAGESRHFENQVFL